MAVRSLRVLVDNVSSDSRLAAEHGWSVWIDAGKAGCFLWDTGQTGLVAQNAAALGIDPTAAQSIALSHGHYDHSGGLATLIEAGYAGPVYGHPDVWQQRYSRRDATTYRSAGMDDGRLPNGLPEFIPVRETQTLAPGLTCVTDIPRRSGNFTATANLFCDTAGHVPDLVPDDAFLVIDTPEGKLALLGCCHAGLANSLEAARDTCGIERFQTVVGGLHLIGAPESAMAETVDALTRFGVTRLYAGHCTGQAGLDYLREHFQGDFTPTGAGLVIIP